MQFNTLLNVRLCCCEIFKKSLNFDLLNEKTVVEKIKKTGVQYSKKKSFRIERKSKERVKKLKTWYTHCKF